MPMLTTLEIVFPVWPTHSPLRSFVANSRICFSTACTSAVTSWPSTSSWASSGARNAVCSTARSSVELMRSPLNIASMRPFRPASSAKASNCFATSPSTKFFERSTWSPAASNV